MYPSFVIGRTVAGSWEFLTPEPVRRSEARQVFEVVGAAKGKYGDTQYVEVAVYDVPRPSETSRFTPPPAPPAEADAPPATPQPRTSAVPAVGVAPSASPETREAYAARIEVMDRPKLLLEAHALNLTVRVGTTNADLRQLIVVAKFPPGQVDEDGSGV